MSLPPTSTLICERLFYIEKINKAEKTITTLKAMLEKEKVARILMI